MCFTIQSISCVVASRSASIRCDTLSSRRSFQCKRYKELFLCVFFFIVWQHWCCGSNSYWLESFTLKSATNLLSRNLEIPIAYGSGIYFGIGYLLFPLFYFFFFFAFLLSNVIWFCRFGWKLTWKRLLPTTWLKYLILLYTIIYYSLLYYIIKYEVYFRMRLNNRPCQLRFGLFVTGH